MRRSRSLAGGAALVALLAGACLVGPLVLPATGDGDPLHASLLPPGTVVTVLELADGRSVMAPDIVRTQDGFELSGPRRDTVVAATAVVGQRRVRLWLGSDRFGRDLLPRLLRGGRVSIAIAGLGLVLSLAIGLAVGLAAATGGRLADAVLMRLVDSLLAFPLLLLLILASALFAPGPPALVAILGATSWMGLARLVRGQVLSLRSRSFIDAARVAGTPEHRIWTLHYLPNLRSPIAQDSALRMGDLVLAEATLSFLGLGLPAGFPSWGAMVADGQRVMIDGWWISVFPGLAITLLVAGLALIGDGLQQAGGSEG